MKPNFQLILLIFFIAAAIFGVLVFSGAIPIGETEGALGTVTMWGSVESTTMLPIVEEFNKANTTFVVKYEEKSAATFDQELLEALARGQGPDLFLLPDNLVHDYADKIFTIPYTSYSLAGFKNTYAGAGEVFLTSKGVLALPLSIDPLVMYYNRSLLDANGIVYPPATWTDLVDMVPILTKKDESNKISKSAVAFGHFANITHAKDIISALFIQAGNPIVMEKEGSFVSVLDAPIGNYNLPSILEFYTSFADPNSALYSWNRSFPNSVDAFSADNVAFYFGYASELPSLVNRNPNQNFFVASMPQIKNSSFKSTGAHVTGLAISSSSKNITTAYTAATLMATSDFASKFVAGTRLSPARRDLLSVKPNDQFSPTFYTSALYAKTWPDPSPKDTDTIFSGMVSGVLSSNLSPDAAIKDASSKMSILLVR